MTTEQKRIEEALRDRHIARNKYLSHLATIKCSPELMMTIIRQHTFVDHGTIVKTATADSFIEVRRAIEESTEFYRSITRCAETSEAESRVRCFVNSN